MAMRSAMNCPECGSEKTRVVDTSFDMSGTYHLVRRHKCINCEHKWYAGVPHAVVLPYVSYLRKGVFAS